MEGYKRAVDQDEYDHLWMQCMQELWDEREQALLESTWVKMEEALMQTLPKEIEQWVHTELSE